jgi:hypothetical protein
LPKAPGSLRERPGPVAHFRQRAPHSLVHAIPPRTLPRPGQPHCKIIQPAPKFCSSRSGWRSQ